MSDPWWHRHGAIEAIITVIGLLFVLAFYCIYARRRDHSRREMDYRRHQLGIEARRLFSGTQTRAPTIVLAMNRQPAQMPYAKVPLAQVPMAKPVHPSAPPRPKDDSEPNKEDEEHHRHFESIQKAMEASQR